MSHTHSFFAPKYPSAFEVCDSFLPFSLPLNKSLKFFPHGHQLTCELTLMVFTEVSLTTVLSFIQPFMQEIFFENLDTERKMVCERQTGSLCTHRRYNFEEKKTIQKNPLQLQQWMDFGGSMVKNAPANAGFHPRVGKIPWRRKWQPTPVFLPGKSHGQRGLEGYSPWGCKESDTTWWLNNNCENGIKERRTRDSPAWGLGDTRLPSLGIRKGFLEEGWVSWRSEGWEGADQAEQEFLVLPSSRASLQSTRACSPLCLQRIPSRISPGPLLSKQTVF